MVPVPAFHSKLPRTDKYHNNGKCPEGHNIKPENRESGTGGHPICRNCAHLTAQGK
jgi:hypothetical protein